MGNLGLFIFRRDLRGFDNSALNALASVVDEIAVIFIFDPRQLASHPFKSHRGLTFLKESLYDLAESLQKNFSATLNIYLGEAEKITEKLIKKFHPTHLAFNKDYTPFSRLRDDALIALCKEFGLQTILEDDTYLLRPNQICTGSHKPYTVFTPFYKKGLKEPVVEPTTSGKLKTRKYVELDLSEKVSDFNKEIISPPITTDGFHGGRSRAFEILETIHQYKNYTETRDIPSLHGTTNLSAHLKFGTISAREVRAAVASAFGDEHPIIRQLFWRDFYGHISAHFPHIYGDSFNRAYSAIKWDDDENTFQRWCDGTTGFPIVDAGMRELNETGFMHNRLRMITASFLIKDLHINWMWGEKYFATKLIDYDPALNNGNWQWVASTGCDAAPYFRVFNPWLQGEKFDPQGAYIKKWIPELSMVEARDLHAPEAPRMRDYPRPMVEHKKEAAETIQRYKIGLHK
jgi:deoxyribodipyrimidine photo-lyase